MLGRKLNTKWELGQFIDQLKWQLGERLLGKLRWQLRDQLEWQLRGLNNAR